MQAIAEDEPPSVATLRRYCDDQMLWVAVDDKDVPVAYVIVEPVDGCVHIEQVSVHPDFAGKRLGGALIETVMNWAASRRCPAVTLTTFSEVPWNAPYYARLGFQVIPEAELSPGLRRIRTQEKELGLDAWPKGLHAQVNRYLKSTETV